MKLYANEILIIYRCVLIVEYYKITWILDK